MTLKESTTFFCRCEISLFQLSLNGWLLINANYYILLNFKVIRISFIVSTFKLAFPYPFNINIFFISIFILNSSRAIFSIDINIAVYRIPFSISAINIIIVIIVTWCPSSIIIFIVFISVICFIFFSWNTWFRLFDMLGSAHVERMIIKVLWTLS